MFLMFWFQQVSTTPAPAWLFCWQRGWMLVISSQWYTCILHEIRIEKLIPIISVIPSSWILWDPHSRPYCINIIISVTAKRQSTATSTILVQWSGRFLMRGTMLGPGLFCPSKWEAILLGLENHLTKARGCKFIVVSFSVPPWKSRSRTMAWGFVLTYCSTFPCTIYFWQ